MTLAFITYLYIVFGKIVSALQVFIAIFCIVVGLLSFILGIAFAENSKIIERLNEFKQIAKKAVMLFLISVLIVSLYPEKSDMKVIVGAYIVEKASTIKEVDKLPKNVVNAVNKYLESINREEK